MTRLNDEEWTKVVDKLLNETVNGQLRWSVHNPKDTVPPVETEHNKGQVYETKLSGKTVRVYGFEYKHWTDEDEYHWLPSVNIEFVNGLTVWQLPETNNRFALLDELERQVTGADDLAREFLDKPIF